MATNVNNNSGNNTQFTDNPNISKGVTGYLMGRMAKNEFSNNFWNEDSGFLKTSIDGLERIEKQYEEIAKSADKLGKVSKKHNEENLTQARLLSKYFNDIKNSREVTDKEAIDAMREYYKLMVKSQEDYLKALKEGYKLQEDGDDDHLKAIQEAEKLLNKTKKLQRDNETYLRNTSKALGQATDNWANSLSDTLGKAGNKLKDITNMFNLQAIANNKYEQSARSKNEIMSSVNKQFGFTNNSQFNDFKNSLNNSLKDMNKSMGHLFNTQDYINYMSNLDKYGITSTQLAQQQMKSSIIAEKYLGVSVETQASIFKLMKRTNDPEMLSNHNKTIVGLLKSQLGVSKEQLDNLTKIATDSNDSKAALGMTPTAINAQNEALTIVGNALTALYGEDTSKAVIESFNDFMSNPGDSGWVKIFGSDYSRLYTSAYNNTSKEEQTRIIQDWLKTAMSSGLLSAGNNLQPGLQSAIGNYYLQGEAGGKSAGFLGLLKNLEPGKFDEYVDKSLQGVLNTTDKDVDKYVDETTQTTLLEKIWNWIDEKLGGIDWKYYNWAATTAFTLYIASGGLKAIGSILDLKGMFGKGGSFINSLSGFLGSGSTIGGALGKLATGGIAVGLTVAAISGIAKATSNAVATKDKITSGNLEYTKSKLNKQGNKLANNDAYANTYAQSVSDNNLSHFSTLWRNF